MPQSFLALIGIVLASLVALHQVQSGHRTDASLEHLTLQSAAADVAAERLAALGALPFDEGVKTERARSVADLSLYANGRFFRPASTDPPGDDLDDFHGARTTVAAVLRDGAPPHPLTADVTVQYVREDDGETPSGARTRLKRATVVVTSPGAAPVRVSQVFSCAGYCVW